MWDQLGLHSEFSTSMGYNVTLYLKNDDDGGGGAAADDSSSGGCC